MRRRPGLVISAAVTVAVPSVLTMYAVLARQHEAVSHSAPAASAPAASAAADGAGGAGTVSGAGKPAPAGPVAAASPAARVALAGPRGTTGGQRALGSSLLGRAADAGQMTSYQGVQVLSQSGVDGTVTMVSHVWHRGGGLTVTQTSNDTRRTAPQTAVSYDPNNRSPEGVFGLTRSLVPLLDKHYSAVYQGTGSALGRSVVIVSVYRFDGSLAARFWLDRRTLVPLRRELFDTSDRLISKEQFTHVRFGRIPRQPTAKSTAGTQSVSPWATAPSPGRVVTWLADQGLQVPGTMPGGLPLFSAQSSGTGKHQVIALEYSDGLYVDSLFVQRGTLTSDMTGWRQVNMAGHQVYVSGRSITWAGEGSVYTMVTDAPPQTVARDVAVLPSTPSPGFLARLGRGLSRLVQLLNPFD